jgi:hypothetical protein
VREREIGRAQSWDSVYLELLIGDVTTSEILSPSRIPLKWYGFSQNGLIVQPITYYLNTIARDLFP